MSLDLLHGPRRGPASGRTSSLVVFLHGYGADGHDLIGLAEPLAGALPDTAFRSPDAPDRCAVNPGGRQWFPITWIDGSSEAQMRAGFLRAARTLAAWLPAAMAAEGVAADRTALVGFSQGTMMSLVVAPRLDATLAGVVGFSGRLADPGPEAGPSTRRPPVLLVHGDEDQVIPVEALAEARAGLAAQGFEVTWHVSRGVGHGIAPDGLRLAAGFLARRLSPPGTAGAPAS
jgi:phospholipase/carboxylesterase